MIDESVKLPVIKVMGREKSLAEDPVVRESPDNHFFQ